MVKLPKFVKRDVLLEWGCGLKISGFWHTRVRDFRNPEDKELGYFGVGNPKVPKEACGHGEKWNFSISWSYLGGRLEEKDLWIEFVYGFLSRRPNIYCRLR
jgi:hypothetical protein